MHDMHITSTIKPWPSDEQVFKALGAIPLINSDRTHTLIYPNNACISLAAALIRVVRTGINEVILTWPNSPGSVSALHTLAALALLGISAERKERLLPFPILYWPWNQHVGVAQKGILVDHQWLYKCHRVG